MNRNPDGWGIMAVVDGFPIIQKGGIPTAKADKYKKTSEDLKHFLDVYDFFKNVPHAVHFRIQTHGNVDEENCHPYAVGSQTFLMHNGTIAGFSSYSKWFDTDKTKSDTWNFAKSISEFADKKWLRNQSFVRLMNILAGENNRLLFMDKDGFFMPRPDLWHTRDGVYYSNTHGVQFQEPTKKNDSKSHSNDWKPHGGCGHYPNNRDSSSSKKSLETNSHKNELLKEFDQNHGHKFFLDGRRVIQLNKPDQETDKSSKVIVPNDQNMKKLVAITDRNRMTPKEVEEGIKLISFMENIPQTPKEWKNLSLWAIRDLVSEEPEMMAEVMWELVHQ